MKLLIAFFCGLALSAGAQLTITVTPGYTFGPGEVPSTSTLNLLGQPTVFVSGTISGTVGLSAGTVTGVHLADSVPDGITLDFNGGSPRQLEVKTAGISTAQIGDNQVTRSKLAAQSVARTNLLAQTVGNTNLDFGIVGLVMNFAANTAPTGWLECNGAAVSRTTYADLFAVISTTWGVGDGSTTFNLPDLRGEFVRGWDHSKGTDSGRAFASHQADAFKDHTHNLTGGTFLMQAGSNFSSGGNNDRSAATATSTATSPNNGGTETRPRNYAMMYVIKY